MRKKILIVEKSETIRSVAENLLRQNGYEVIGLTDPEKALELIEFTRPDLILSGCELTGKDKKPFYESFQVNPNLNKIPLLLFADKGNDSLPFPPEVLIFKPIDPKDFLGKVAVFASPRSGQHDSGDGHSGDSSLNDEFLDSALGVDGLNVLDSEEMDKSGKVTKKTKGVPSKNDLGLGPAQASGKSGSDSTGVESISIKNDSSKLQKIEPSQKPVDVTASNKLDILDDQYGISDPGTLVATDTDAGHDYNWFVNEMQTDSKSEAASSSPATKAAPAGEGGVEKFIDEFKKEVQKFQDDELLDSSSEELINQEQPKESQSDLAKAVGNISQEQLNLFTRQLSYDLAEKIAVKIIERLDGDKLLRLIKDEIISEAKRQKNPSK